MNIVPTPVLTVGLRKAPPGMQWVWLFLFRLIRAHAVMVLAVLTARSASAESLGVERLPAGAVAIRRVETDQPPRRFTIKIDGVASTIAGGDLRVVYSNTLGDSAFSFGSRIQVADDIRTVGAAGCLLDRFMFVVTGDADGFGSGPFAVDYALHHDCPNAGGLKISGTIGRVELPDSGTYMVEVQIPVDADIPLRSDFWISMKTNRAHAGPIGGAPPLIGFSDDAFGHQFFGCRLWLGPYPGGPHASFNVQIFVREPCDPTFVAYRASAPPLSAHTPGANIRIAEDIEMVSETCELMGYEVAIRGSANYEFDLRFAAPSGGGPGERIPGTTGFYPGFGLGLQVASFQLDPAVEVTSPLWLTMVADSDLARVALTGRSPGAGRTEHTFAVETPSGWNITSFPEGANGVAMHVTLRCRGAAPIGACCDMQFTDADGDAVCREIPEPNCPFPRWIPGAACDPEPFAPRCGLSACCMADGTCEHRTQRRCQLGGTTWNRGAFCEESELECPNVCVVSEASCTFAHEGGGCVDAACCEAVCSRDPFCCEFQWDAECAAIVPFVCRLPPSNDQCAPDGPAEGARSVVLPASLETNARQAAASPEDRPFCCHNGFNPVCNGGCRDGNLCQNDDGCRGADDGACNEEGTCAGGCAAGIECEEDADCPGTSDGVCPQREPTPEAPVFGSVWYRFVVPSGGGGSTTAVEVSTCGSNAPAKDSLLQVFSIREPDRGVCDGLGDCADGSFCDVAAQDCADETECVETVRSCTLSLQDCPSGGPCLLDGAAACDGLSVIACNDDAPDGCGDPTQSHNSTICLPDLTRGESYYVAIAAKTPDTVGAYRLTVREVAVCNDISPPNDYCTLGLKVMDGTHGFDLSTATATCPVEGCSLSAPRATWFDYLAPIDGHAVVSACDDGLEMVVYAGCDCSTIEATPNIVPICCDEPVIEDCSGGPRCTINVDEGACYKIRIGTGESGDRSGAFTITSQAGSRCPEGAVTWIDPPTGVVDARTPIHPQNGTDAGIDAVRLLAPDGASTGCWAFCDSENTAVANSIVRLVEHDNDVVSLRFARPITVGEGIAVSYIDDVGSTSTGLFVVHPGNVDGDGIAGPEDVRMLVDILLDRASSPWGVFSEDIDHSGYAGPGDVVALIDLLNGAGSATPWMDTPRPAPPALCP